MIAPAEATRTRPSRPALPLTGGCLCGAIRYEIAGFPLLLYTCSCTDCQSRSGSAFAVNMPVKASDFRVVRGQPKAWRHVSPSGVNVASWFCGDCGGPIYGERDGRPESVTARAGTLDDTSWVVPVAHFFMRSAQSWAVKADGAVCFATAPENFRELAQAWQAIWEKASP